MSAMHIGQVFHTDKEAFSFPKKGKGVTLIEEDK